MDSGTAVFCCKHCYRVGRLGRVVGLPPPPAPGPAGVPAVGALHHLSASLLIAFAVVTLLLVGAGLFATVSALVQQRTREIGVRMALGARVLVGGREPCADAPRDKGGSDAELEGGVVR